MHENNYQSAEKPDHGQQQEKKLDSRRSNFRMDGLDHEICDGAKQ